MSSSDPVNVIAGWMASGMQPCSVSGASTPTPLPPEVWATMAPGRTGRGGREARHQATEFGVGDRQQQQFGTAGDLVDRQHGSVGKPTLGALPRRLRNRAARDHHMLGALQRHTERSADPTSGNDADREPRRAEDRRGAPCRRPR